MKNLEAYAEVAGRDVIAHLRQLAVLLKGVRVVHVNSTRQGGGVAEILDNLVPLKQDLGIDVSWEIVTGEEPFYQCTKSFHNALQGKRHRISPKLIEAYERTNLANAEILYDTLRDADIVVIHDPQPLPLLRHIPDRRGKWVWRCHIDVSKPDRNTWKYLREYAEDYDASIFSLSNFAQPLSHPQYLIPPSIDPLSEKNRDLDMETVRRVHNEFNIDLDRPIMVQVSRYDRFKDPLGVIDAYKLAKRFSPDLQLVLAGGGASDDPEGAEVIAEVREASAGDPDIHVLLLPADAHTTINALQRGADIVLQKSIREGFGLTVTEALWKGKPVIGGNTGGIKLQVLNHHTGFLVSTPEGAALRLRYLLQHPEEVAEISIKAREFVRENFLLTRHLREYLTLMVALTHEDGDRINLD